MRRMLRNSSLTLVTLGLFFSFLLAQSLTGLRTYNDERRMLGEETIGYWSYLQTGHFVEATFENWESEYLQMAFYVLFTAFLFQRGSAESKDPDKSEAVDQDPRTQVGRASAPWPVRRGGIALALYEHSLTLALSSLFVVSFAIHAWGGAREFNEEQLAHGQDTVSTLGFIKSSEFWFQSFQNWQSEFLAVASLVILSTFLRQRGSPESKPVAAPLRQTGSEPAPTR
jgi:hypothetical protein